MRGLRDAYSVVNVLRAAEIIFSVALSRFIASESGWSGGVMAATWLNPAARSASLSLTLPARAITATPCAEAARSTPIGALPWSVWPSSAPPPVATKSASRTMLSKSQSPSTISMPERSSACNTLLKA